MEVAKSPMIKPKRKKGKRRSRRASMIRLVIEPEIEILECPAFKGFQVEFEGVGYWLVIRNYLSDEPDPDTYSPGNAYIFA